jgi:alpha-tubulin suppressor-like RCC1 family protein
VGAALIVLAGTALAAVGGGGNAAAAPVAPSSNPGGTVVAWGSDDQGQTDVPSGLTDVIAVSAGGYHSMALTRTGRVVAWGTTLPGHDSDNFGQANVPAGLTGVRAIAAAYFGSLVLLGDGTVRGYGKNATIPAGLHDVVAIAAGGSPLASSYLAVTADNHVVTWGYAPMEQPPCPCGIRKVSLGISHALLLATDYTVHAWGDNSFNQVAPLPEALSGMRVLSMSAGANHSLALMVGPPAALVAVSGDDQEVPVRQNIEAPIVAVQDSAGSGVPGEPVTFTVSGRAAFADGTHTATVITDTTGHAESPSLRAANQTGTATITATSGSFAPVTFTDRIISTPPGLLQ